MYEAGQGEIPDESKKKNLYTPQNIVSCSVVLRRESWLDTQLR